MRPVIAIHPDYYNTAHGPQSFSDRWFGHLADLGIEARKVSAFSPDFPRCLDGASAFMWRGTTPRYFEAARKIIPAVEQGMGILTFPSSRLALIAQDKIVQSFLLQAAGLPLPGTRVCFSTDAAHEYLQSAAYPLVLKLAKGSRSTGVALARDIAAAQRYVGAMFGTGAAWLRLLERPWAYRFLHRARATVQELLGLETVERHHGYAYFQEFVPGNAFDIRVTVIGQFATGFRRFNRPGDFRASGSGRIDWNPDAVPRSAVKLAFEVSRRLELPFVAVDVLFDGEQPLVCELNLAYLAWAVDRCPGYWVLEDAADCDAFRWQDAEVDCAVLTLCEFLRLGGLGEVVEALRGDGPIVKYDAVSADGLRCRTEKDGG